MDAYTIDDLMSFADFHYRWASTGLTMEELILNWQKYKEAPRGMILILKPMADKMIEPSPAPGQLRDILSFTCAFMGEDFQRVNSKCRKRELVTVRQMVAFVGLRCGFIPSDFEKILGPLWERTSIYARSRKCSIYARVEHDFREKLNFVLDRFDLDKYE